ncbi:hypothetical protein [Cupriavidus sp. amp6]|uniref:hypothetical protein n=1 Tax=Cupriavidus sp. amp6 TaxID=388051 RepID=UPI00048ED524|nr:hypothetical protein [Cupriavidus sp. amp6]
MDSSRRIDLGLSRESAEVEAFVKCLHDTPTAPGFDRVQYPGEFEAANREHAADAIDINPAIWRNLEQLAQAAGVPVPKG